MAGDDAYGFGKAEAGFAFYLFHDGPPAPKGLFAITAALPLPPNSISYAGFFSV